MTVSDWISISCAVASLITAIVIAILQIRQSTRMEQFEKRQDKRDEERHAESVKAQAVSFISKYYNDRGLIPLCAIAAMYNPLFYYTRSMYRDFCCYTKETQNAILKYCGLDLLVKENDIYNSSVDELRNVITERFPQDKDIYYDQAKYIERSLTRYGKEALPHSDSNYENHITDILSEAFQCGTQEPTPIEQLTNEYDFGNCLEIEACQLASVIAEYIAIYNATSRDMQIESDKNYGSPGGYAGETINTMEDLFLKALFEMYVNLVLNKHQK